VSPAAHDQHTRKILDKLAESSAVSQRLLSRELGIALGLTNSLFRRLVASGLVQLVRLRPNHVRYVLTPAGIAQKARLSRAYFLRTVRSYAEARDRVSYGLSRMGDEAGGAGIQTVVFFGAGEIAEVAWVCLQRTRLELVAVVDDAEAGKDFFGLVVLPASALSADACNGVRYDRLVVTATSEEAALTSTLSGVGVPSGKVVWL
jgi:hypothetical protein